MPKAENMVEARVLCAGEFGKVDDVVTVPESVAKNSGDLDPHPDAVEYAKSLKPAAPAADAAA